MHHPDGFMVLRPLGERPSIPALIVPGATELEGAFTDPRRQAIELSAAGLGGV
jgi:hypothetical protein